MFTQFRRREVLGEVVVVTRLDLLLPVGEVVETRHAVQGEMRRTGVLHHALDRVVLLREQNLFTSLLISKLQNRKKCSKKKWSD